ncbi:hypothetical protein ACWGH2_07985 [Streptomyces sp. NPDC054871]
MKLKNRAASTLTAGALLGASLVAAGATNAGASVADTAADICSFHVAINNSSGVAHLRENVWLKKGPYASCGDSGHIFKGGKFYVWCITNNTYGNAWYYGREAGTDEKGWVYAGNLNVSSGSLNKCVA